MSIPHKLRVQKGAFAPTLLITNGVYWSSERLENMPKVTEFCVAGGAGSETQSSRFPYFMAHPTEQGDAYTVSTVFYNPGV